MGGTGTPESERPSLRQRRGVLFNVWSTRPDGQNPHSATWSSSPSSKAGRGFAGRNAARCVGMVEGT